MANKIIKKVVKGIPKPDTCELDHPDAYQTVKGVQYLRPMVFQFTTAGLMQWVYDVENYPDVD